TGSTEPVPDAYVVTTTSPPDPYYRRNVIAASAPPAGYLLINDFADDPSFIPAPVPVSATTPGTRGVDWRPFWRYHWTNRIFDYLTVQSPDDDYLPDVSAVRYDP